MEQLRILFTSVGRRVELMQEFRRAARELHIPLRIYGADITKSAPALLFCDHAVEVCRIRDEAYIPMLLQICQREKIHALIPTIDTDLLILAQNKEKFLSIGTRVIVSDEDKVRLCRDKRYTADYFRSLGLNSPLPVDDYRHYAGGFPAFIKPKDGSSSISAYKVNDAEELAAYAAQVPDYIVQPYIQGVEYTVDVFCDFDGAPIYITPRIRHAVRAGEVLKTEIVNDPTIIREVEILLADYKPCGAITVQLIRQEETGEDYYIEINPRFGGGAPCSIKAGADSAGALLRLLGGEKLSFAGNAAAEHAVYSRYDQSACITCPGKTVRAVVFDLDDTLYSEKDYVRSGFRAVARVLSDVDRVYDKLWAAFEQGLPAIDTVLHQENIRDEGRKAACLQAYRGHTPQIALYDGVKHMLEDLRAAGIKLGILTDGRPEGQRNKLEALGLAELVDEIIITDELGGEAFRKPDDIAFRMMQRKLNVPFSAMVYVGDNMSKDFTAPRQLGMQYLWLCNPDGLYCAQGQQDGFERKIHAITDVIDYIKTAEEPG